MKKHRQDIKVNKDATILIRFNKTQYLNVDFESYERIADYDNLEYAFEREAIKIILNESTFYEAYTYQSRFR